ncbi:unnamed protein product, partial [Iphiclides podalirius]
MMDTVKTVRDTSTNIIAERRKLLQQFIDETRKNNKNVDVEVEKLIADKLSDDACLLDKFLLSKSSNDDVIPDEVVNEEISLVCFTGHYTTTMTMSHTLYCLAKYPSDLSKMKYLEAVIKESIRVIPTVTKIGRQLEKDLELADGRIVPAKSAVIVFYEAMFVNPKIFPEPERYDPERFLSNMHQFAFVPFSAGPRNCIGFRYAWVAMKATLSNIIRRYEILPGGPGSEPLFKYRIITESENGIHLKLKKRTY